MKTITLTLAAFAASALIGGSYASGDGPQAIPACVTGSDWDQDGRSNDTDVTADDSCTASTTGAEDCSTGAGDGIPDCDSTGL